MLPTFDKHDKMQLLAQFKRILYVHIGFRATLNLCLTRSGNYEIHKFDWLESKLTMVWIFLSRPPSGLVTFCREDVVH